MLWKTRFLNRQQRLLALYDAFQTTPTTAMQPVQLAKLTDIPVVDVVQLLDATPELFVRLPKRGDLGRRYRVLTSIAALDRDGVEALIHGHARNEKLLVGALVGMGACVALILLLMGTMLAGVR